MSQVAFGSTGDMPSRREDPNQDVPSSMSSVTRTRSSLELPSSASDSSKLNQTILTRAFKKVFPELTSNINPLDYVDHLLAKDVINFESMFAIRRKNDDTKGSQDAARELLVQVCARDGGCQAMMDLFSHRDVNQHQLYEQVFTEYNHLLPNTYGTTAQHLEAANVSDGTSMGGRQSKFSKYYGRYAEVTVEVSFTGDIGVDEQTSDKTRLRTALTPGNPFWKELDDYLRSIGCILLRTQPNHDPTMHIIIPGLKLLADVTRNMEFEWEDLSSILLKSAMRSHGEELPLCCTITKVEMKPFLSENQRTEINSQLLRGLEISHGDRSVPLTQSSVNGSCHTQRIKNPKYRRDQQETNCFLLNDAADSKLLDEESLATRRDQKHMGQLDLCDGFKLIPERDSASKIERQDVNLQMASKPVREWPVQSDTSSTLNQKRQPDLFTRQRTTQAESSGDGILYKRSQDSTDESEMSMPQSPPKPDSCGAKPKGLGAPESDLMVVLRKVTATKLGVGKTSSSRSSKLMNDITREIVNSLQKEHNIVMRPEFTGSSFEGVKIELADEYDVMILLNGEDLELDEQYPGYVALRPRDPNCVTFKPFLASDGYIDPKQIRSKLYSWIQMSINKRFPVDYPYLVQIKMQGPAVTLTIRVNDKTPRPETADEAGQIDPDFKIDVDLVATFDIRYQQFVAKPFKPTKVITIPKSSAASTLWWRRSFSLDEKRRLKKIDEDSGCRRQCLRLLKFLRLRESTLKCLPSYCYKMLLLNECYHLQDKKDWEKEMLAERFLGLLQSMVSCLQEKNLPNCFDTRINLLENLSEKAIGNIKDRTKKILSKGVVEISKLLDKDPIK